MCDDMFADGQRYAREEDTEVLAAWLTKNRALLSRGRWLLEMIYDARDTPESVAAEILRGEPDA